MVIKEYRQPYPEKALRLMTQIRDEHLSAVLTTHKTDTGYIVIEEYVEGVPLQDLLEGGKCFSEKETISIALQLCGALWALHRQGLVHRDVKPANIIMTETGAVKLVDFNTARLYGEQYEQDTRYLGTVGYAPPEQYGFSQTDQRADIYALGVTLRALFSGAHSRLKSVVGRCTQLDPALRYQTIGDVFKVLRRKQYPLKIIGLSSLALICLICCGALTWVLSFQSVPLTESSVPETGHESLPEFQESLQTSTSSVSSSQAMVNSQSEALLSSEPEPISSAYSNNISSELEKISPPLMEAVSSEIIPETAEVQAPPADSAAIAEMFYGYWKFRPDYELMDGVPIALTYSGYDIKLSAEAYYEATSESQAVSKSEYDIQSAIWGNPVYWIGWPSAPDDPGQETSLGEGYYLRIAIHYTDYYGNDDTYDLLLYMEDAYSDTIYRREIVQDESGQEYISEQQPPRFVNMQRKEANQPPVTFQVGDTVKTGGYFDVFVGTVVAIDGERIQVYWEDLVDMVWGTSVVESYSDTELRMSEMISGAKLFGKSWHSSDKLYK